ncbi:MAG: hypothetical protein ABI559_06925 [Chloroflexota bacterium]
MTRGGKRPGAGAPKGNLNGLKHGRNSRLVQQFVDLIASEPAAARLLADIQRQNERRAARARNDAQRLLDSLIQRIDHANKDRDSVIWELNQRIPPPAWRDPGDETTSNKSPNPINRPI